jgi:excisionase family DNA binding protein
MTEQLMQNVLSAIRTCDVERLPRVLGMLAEISETCRARLAGTGAPAPAAPDELLTCAQAAERLQCSRDYLYKAALPFRRKLGRKTLFSSQGIDEYLKNHK